MIFQNDDSIMEKNLSRERVFDGIILHIDHVTNQLPNGKAAKREIAVHVGASAVLPIDGEGNEYGYPWRYTEDGDPNEYYQILKDVFQYPNATDTRW